MSQSVDQKPSRTRLSGPPFWLLAVLAGCVALLILFAMTRGGGDAGQAAEFTPEPTVSVALEPTQTPAATPSPTPEPPSTPAAEAENAQPVPQGEKVEMEWFSA